MRLFVSYMPDNKMTNPDKNRPAAVFRKGFCLCSSGNELQADSFASSEKKAIKKHFGKKGWKKAWALAQAEGWSVKLVYTRLFVPVFYSSYASVDTEVTLVAEDCTSVPITDGA